MASNLESVRFEARAIFKAAVVPVVLPLVIILASVIEWVVDFRHTFFVERS